MKNFIIALIILKTLIASAQEKTIAQIELEVNSIEANRALTKTEFDWVELTGMTTDGGGILTIWRDKEQIYKIVEEIGLSYGRMKITIYLTRGIPIKIIETEENFELTDDGINYSELKEVFKKEVLFFDWELGDAKVKETGKRVMSEGGCSHYEDYEPILERANQAIK